MLEKQINDDIKVAMKAKDALVLDTLRMVKLAFSTANTEKNAKELTEARAVQILQKLVKTREETAEVYKQAGREDLMAKELREAAVIKQYLPDVIEESELNLIIATVIIDLEPTKKDMGKVMKEVSARATATGKAVDGKLLSEKVKHFLL